MHQKLEQSNAKPWFLIILSFAIIYIVWGATYLFVAFAVEEIPPFRMAGIRFTTAAVLMFLLALLLGKLTTVTFRQFRNAAVGGMMFLGIGTGGTAWALQYIDSGLTSLIIATEPLIIVLMMWGMLNKQPSFKAFLGIGLGLLGAYLLVAQDQIFVNQEDWFAVLAIGISITTWGYATIFVSQADLPKTQMVNTGIQLGAGASVLWIASWITQEPPINLHQISWRAWGSLSFLIIFGSIIVFSAFNFLLKRVSPAKVATSTYVNPVIALLLGWWLRDELVTNQSILAAVILLSGVFLINSDKD